MDCEQTQQDQNEASLQCRGRSKFTVGFHEISSCDSLESYASSHPPAIDMAAKLQLVSPRMKLVWTVLLLAGTVLAPVEQQQQTIEQQRQEAERRASEQRRQQEDENRRKRMEEILGPSTVGLPRNIPFVLEPGVCTVMPEDTG